MIDSTYSLAKVGPEWPGCRAALDLSIFPIKSQLVNILGFTGHMVTSVTLQPLSQKSSHKQYRNEWVKLYWWKPASWDGMCPVALFANPWSWRHAHHLLMHSLSVGSPGSPVFSLERAGSTNSFKAQTFCLSSRGATISSLILSVLGNKNLIYPF
jgi:hypothetical protein